MGMQNIIGDYSVTEDGVVVPGNPRDSSKEVQLRKIGEPGFVNGWGIFYGKRGKTTEEKVPEHVVYALDGSVPSVRLLQASSEDNGGWGQYKLEIGKQQEAVEHKRGALKNWKVVWKSWSEVKGVGESVA
jgi:hypothetical protein